MQERCNKICTVHRFDKNDKFDSFLGKLAERMSRARENQSEQGTMTHNKMIVDDMNPEDLATLLLLRPLDLIPETTNYIGINGCRFPDCNMDSKPYHSRATYGTLKDSPVFIIPSEISRVAKKIAELKGYLEMETLRHLQVSSTPPMSISEATPIHILAYNDVPSHLFLGSKNTWEPEFHTIARIPNILEGTPSFDISMEYSHGRLSIYPS